MFSKSCKYGIKAVVYIAGRSLKGERVKVGDITTHVGLPEAFTAKILGTLNRQGIVQSYTGPNGGFEIDLTAMKNTPLSTVVKAIDGDEVYEGCALGLHECDSNHPCPMHYHFVAIRNNLKSMLQTTTIYEMAQGLQSGQTMLTR